MAPSIGAKSILEIIPYQSALDRFHENLMKNSVKELQSVLRVTLYSAGQGKPADLLKAQVFRLIHLQLHMNRKSYPCVEQCILDRWLRTLLDKYAE
jgi:hypothetical protein